MGERVGFIEVSSLDGKVEGPCECCSDGKSLGFCVYDGACDERFFIDGNADLLGNNER